MEALDLYEYTPKDIWAIILRHIDVFQFHKFSLISKDAMGDATWNLLRTVRVPASRLEKLPKALIRLLSTHSDYVDELSMFHERPLVPVKPIAKKKRMSWKDKSKIHVTTPFAAYLRKMAPHLRSYKRCVNVEIKDNIESLLNPKILESLSLETETAWSGAPKLFDKEFPKLTYLRLIQIYPYNDTPKVLNEAAQVLLLLPERAKALEHIKLDCRFRMEWGVPRVPPELPVRSFIDQTKATLKSIDIGWIPAEFELLKRALNHEFIEKDSERPEAELAALSQELTAACNETLGLPATALKIKGKTLFAISMDELPHHLPIEEFKAQFETYHSLGCESRTAHAIRSFVFCKAYDSAQSRDHLEYLLDIIERSPEAFWRYEPGGVEEMGLKSARILKAQGQLKLANPLLQRALCLPGSTDVFLKPQNITSQLAIIKMAIQTPTMSHAIFDIDRVIENRRFVGHVINDPKLFELTLKNRNFSLIPHNTSTEILEYLLSNVPVDTPQWNILMQEILAHPNRFVYEDLIRIKTCRDIIFSNDTFGSIWAKLVSTHTLLSPDAAKHFCSETHIPALIKLLHINLGLPPSTSATTLPMGYARTLCKELWTRQITIAKEPSEFIQAANAILAVFPTIPIIVLQFLVGKIDFGMRAQYRLREVRKVVSEALLELGVIPSTKDSALKRFLESFGRAMEFEKPPKKIPKAKKSKANAEADAETETMAEAQLEAKAETDQEKLDDAPEAKRRKLNDKEREDELPSPTAPAEQPVVVPGPFGASVSSVDGVVPPSN